MQITKEELYMEDIQFLTEEERNALSFKDLAKYLQLLNMLKTEMEALNDKM